MLIAARPTDPKTTGYDSVDGHQKTRNSRQRGALYPSVQPADDRKSRRPEELCRHRRPAWADLPPAGIAGLGWWYDLRGITISMANNFDHLQSACRRIAEDCLYTAQTHFEKASTSAKRTKRWLVLFPSLISAASGLAVAIGAPGWIGGFAAVAGVTSGVATYLGVDKEASAHEVAGKLLTQLRHEAISLCDVYAHDMPVDQYASQVRALQNRYAAFVASLPLTDDDAFKKAQAKIRAGTFKYDSDSSVAPSTSAPALPASMSKD